MSHTIFAERNPLHWREYRMMLQHLKAHAARHRGQQLTIETLAHEALVASEIARGLDPLQPTGGLPNGWCWGKYGRCYGYDGERWTAHFWFVDWSCLSFGLHVCTKGNIEIHLPFGFFRLGRNVVWSGT